MNDESNEQVEMTELLQLAVEEEASDLHISVNSPPVLRIHGSLTPLDVPVLTPDDTERLMKSTVAASSTTRRL